MLSLAWRACGAVGLGVAEAFVAFWALALGLACVLAFGADAFFLAMVFLRSSSVDVAVGVVGQHLVNDLGYLRFQLVNKLLRIVVAVLDVAQFLFPNAS